MAFKLINGGFLGEMVVIQRRIAWRGSPKPGVPRGWKMCPADFLVSRASPGEVCWVWAYRLGLQASPISPISSFRLVFRLFHAYNSSFNIV
ncbi:hypothetical protein E3N88_18076 [Mikania micrantha]|uniref:Uncharacterized protein n=1 Tax=Mikania micrantha TaxID=192012 RepID=A0A5N6NV31_9ASTR|nr:hypothetical protein E3N88_18076 [Mikania micrantha]